MFDILTLIPGKKKHTQSGWYSFNAVCCHHNNHRADTRKRAGIHYSGNDNWTYNCFNCGFKCSFVLGRPFTHKLKKFLSWCGMDDSDIQKWNLYSLQHRDMLETLLPERKQRKIEFRNIGVPAGAVPIVENDSKFKRYVDYLHSRGLNVNDYNFMATPDATGRYRDRIIIPYYYRGSKTVGYTSRYIDGRSPKYINEQQNGYLFGREMQQDNWEVCVVFEGILDAITMRGCALMHSTISDDQAVILRNLYRKVIIVPDMDKSGLEIIDRALELGFHVSIPDWGPGVKDANDAALKYGRTATLLSILQHATTSKIKLEMARKKIDQRL